jgi:NADPH:quinone reductase-like Zn-dependent oxidoreductase
MKAITYHKYGGPEVLQLAEIEKPYPKNNEILLKIKATAVNSGDCRLRKADPFAVRLFFGLTKPKINILGSVFSGEVESAGKDVTNFKVGDLVFGHTDLSFGTYAEYKCIPENGSIAVKPAHLSHLESAVIPFGALTALYFLKLVSIQKGQKVLIVGASGAVGSAAIQIAKSMGAIVTGVCSTSNSNLIKSLGAHKVIDYTKDEFNHSEDTFDVIFDTVNSLDIAQSEKMLNVNGSMILSAAGITEMIKGFWISLKSNRKVITGVIKHTAKDMQFLKQLIESGQFKPVIDRAYSLEQISAAHEYADKRHKKGNLAIEIK